MPDPLSRMARAVEGDPFFLAGLLADFARSEDMDDAALAAHLGCPIDQLAKLKLCGAPHAEPARFRADIDQLSHAFGLDRDRFVDAVLQGRVLQDMRQSEAPLMLAARDRDEETPP